MAWTGMSWLAFIIILIGVIMIVIGIILLEMANSKGQPQKAYLWFLIYGGLVIGIIGGVWLAFTLRPKQKIEVINTKQGHSVQVQQPNCPPQQVNYPPPQPVNYPPPQQITYPPPQTVYQGAPVDPNYSISSIQY